LGLVEA
jgi:hypothetical protein